MNEPKRWLDEGAPEDIGRMLAAASTEQPSEASLGRTLATVGAALGATAAAASASAAGVVASGHVALFASASWAKWALVSTAVLAAGTGAVVATRPEAPHAPPGPLASQQRSVAPPPAAPVPSLRALPVPALQASSVTDAVAPPRIRAVGPKAVGSARTEAPIDAERLSDEVRLVDEARAALAAGRADATLAALDAYDREFPVRRFAPEALYLRMRALLLAQRHAEARDVAARLVAKFPDSPHTARARQLLARTIP